MDYLDGFIFILKLPYHIFHTLTFGKYSEKETNYKSAGIITLVFSLLGIIIFLLYQLSLFIK